MIQPTEHMLSSFNEQSKCCSERMRESPHPERNFLYPRALSTVTRNIHSFFLNSLLRPLPSLCIRLFRHTGTCAIYSYHVAALAMFNHAMPLTTRPRAIHCMLYLVSFNQLCILSICRLSFKIYEMPSERYIVLIWQVWLVSDRNI